MNLNNLRIFLSLADSAVQSTLLVFLRNQQLTADTFTKITDREFDTGLYSILIIDDLSLDKLSFLGKKQLCSYSVLLLSNKYANDQLIDLAKLGVNEVMSYPPDLPNIAAKITQLYHSNGTKILDTKDEMLIDKKHISKPLSIHSGGYLPSYLNLIDTSALEPIYGKCLPIQQLRDLMEHLSRNVSTVFISGEYGTEIDKVATWVHKKSIVRTHEMAHLCCIGLDSQRVDHFFSELKERVTSSSPSNSFAHGTLYISNLQELDEHAQNSFYRNYLGVIQPNIRINSKATTGFRLIVSARDSIFDLVKKGKFRQDLFDALNTIPVGIPSLKERVEDIPLLANKYLQNYMEANPHYMGKSFAPNAINYLSTLDWFGNDAELKKKIERICVLVQHPLIMSDDIKLFIKNSVSTGQIQNMFEKYDDFQSFKDASERLFLVHFLDKYAWNVSKAADAVKIQRSHLYNKIKKYNIVRD
jgi:transcriptional regulator with PAS, ATPase and Fis domain